MNVQNSQDDSISKSYSKFYKYKKKSNNSSLNKESSPYNSQHEMKILHDYFDVNCERLGLNKGLPIGKLKKINKSLSQSKLHEEE